MSLGTQFSAHFAIRPSLLKKIGVFDPTLDVDAPLFIDPFLLPHSRHKEFSSCGFEAYEAHFTRIYDLLRLSNERGDKAWKSALKLFLAGEARGFGGTCLGYSKSSTRGRGFGKVLSIRSLLWAQQVINLGVKDPELFSSLSLFEEGIGPDLISDMVLRVVFECVLRFNHRVIRALENESRATLPLVKIRVGGVTEMMLENPFDLGTPIILLGDDILKYLPLMSDVTQLPHLIGHNADLRERVNEHISEVFKIRFKNEKRNLRNKAMIDGNTFQTFLDLLKELEKTPYDASADPQGLVKWKAIADNFAALFKLEIDKPPSLSTIAGVEKVVSQIVKHFKDLVELNRMYRVFYSDDHQPRHERFAQLLFYSIASSYCIANNLDISPESNAGAGPVDFKVSRGSDKVLVEIKLSTNSSAVKGLENQLVSYLEAEKTYHGHYVLIDVGGIGNKWNKIQDVHSRNSRFKERKQIWLVNAKEVVSASKR